MEISKRSGGSKLDKFFAGKGFYIVLFLCAAVIGVSVWTLMSGEKTVEADQGADITLEQPANVQEPPVDAQQGESNEAMWEIPEGVEEVPEVDLLLVAAARLGLCGLNGFGGLFGEAIEVEVHGGRGRKRTDDRRRRAEAGTRKGKCGNQGIRNGMEAGEPQRTHRSQRSILCVLCVLCG